MGQKAWIGVVAVAGGFLLGQPAWGQRYVGAKRCGSCHPFELQKWQAGPHAKAHEVLSEAQLGDPKCNTCHTIPVSAQAPTGLPGVQCESCHGAGQYYHPEYVMRDKELARIVGLVDPKASVCQRCHNEGAPSVRPFDYTFMWSLIDHGAQARAAWEKQQAAASPSPK